MKIKETGFTEEEKSHLKASEIRDIRGHVLLGSEWLLYSILTGFASVVALVSFVIWENKTTLFLTISIALLYALTISIFFFIAARGVVHRKNVKEAIIERMKNYE